MSEAKPYKIPKQLVWDAYQRVKANRGAAGVDGESLAAFEQELPLQSKSRGAAGFWYPVVAIQTHDTIYTGGG